MKDTVKSETKKTYASWRKSETTDGITKSIEVNEVENGYVIEVEKYGNIGKNKEWDTIRKKYISKTNPLEAEESSKKDEFDEQFDSLKELFKS